MEISLWFKRSLIIVGGLVLVIQFIPVSHSNPPKVKELTWDSPKTKAFAKRACFDCHSNETKWPWYSYVAPMSWLVAQDVKDARERFNFSDIGPQDRAGILVKRINNGEMPLPRYLMLHLEAHLSDAEKQDYIAGLRHSFALSGLGLGEEEGDAHEHVHSHKQ